MYVDDPRMDHCSAAYGPPELWGFENVHGAVFGFGDKFGQSVRVHVRHDGVFDGILEAELPEDERFALSFVDRHQFSIRQTEEEIVATVSIDVAADDIDREGSLAAEVE